MYVAYAETARSLANCKTIDEFLAALGIEQGPDLDEVSKILQGLHNLAGKKDKKQVYEVFFALLATIVGLGISAKHVDEKTMNKDYAIAALDIMRNFHMKGTTITGIFASTPGNT